MKGFLSIVTHFVFVLQVYSWNDGSVLLRDVQVLTLYKGRFTTARRSSPIPQLQCVGGSAGCGAFIPEVVQCQNKGWDGVDVQWECKTDMSTNYRFGRIEVSCEGYNHPDDAYILKGSCGLEYTLELTEDGQRKTGGSSYGSKGFGGFGDFASGFFSNNHHHHGKEQKPHSSSPMDSDNLANLVGFVVLLLLAYSVYKLFLSGNTAQGGQARDWGSYPDNNRNSDTTGPTPPGFKPEFTGGTGPNPHYGFNSDYTSQQHYPGGFTAPGTGGGFWTGRATPGTGGGSWMGRSAPGTGGGFWTGLGTGGVLGYLFGRQTRGQSHSTSYNYDPNIRPPRNPTSSGTRTASGFGGTKRR